MKNGTLTKDAPEAEFVFMGSCNILAKGKGTLTIERDLGTGYEVMTNKDGVPLIFVDATGTGILYNSTIESIKKIKHRLVGSNGDIHYAISAEER
jgi:hypothetical protein